MILGQLYLLKKKVVLSFHFSYQSGATFWYCSEDLRLTISVSLKKIKVKSSVKDFLCLLQDVILWKNGCVGVWRGE